MAPIRWPIRYLGCGGHRHVGDHHLHQQVCSFFSNHLRAKYFLPAHYLQNKFFKPTSCKYFLSANFLQNIFSANHFQNTFFKPTSSKIFSVSQLLAKHFLSANSKANLFQYIFQPIFKPTFFLKVFSSSQFLQNIFF